MRLDGIEWSLHSLFRDSGSLDMKEEFDPIIVWGLGFCQLMEVIETKVEKTRDDNAFKFSAEF